MIIFTKLTLHKILLIPASILEPRNLRIWSGGVSGSVTQSSMTLAYPKINGILLYNKNNIDYVNVNSMKYNTHLMDLTNHKSQDMIMHADYGK